MADAPFRKSTRRQFLREWGVASSALTFSPFFLERMSTVCEAAAGLTRVYKVLNGDAFQNIQKLWQMLDGPARYISPSDVVVIKANGQWPNQGYTHTGCIKAVVDSILQIPGFSGEVLICDNVQGGGVVGALGFDATLSNQNNNWAGYDGKGKNWNQLAADYRAAGKPVATVQWSTDTTWRTPFLPTPSYLPWNPASGPGWYRYFVTLNGRNTYLSCPVFQSPLTPGRLIDMEQGGVWESGVYTGRKVKAIFMPTLNNHGTGSEDYAGVTSAIKSFYGATEIYHGAPFSDDYVWNNWYSIHSASYTKFDAYTAGQLVGTFINNLYSPMLYITAAMYSGWYSRTGPAAATNTVLACTNPVSLDYISCRDVISPYASWLNPTLNNNTSKQITGCASQGIGTADPNQIEVITYDFNRPTATRLDIERKIRDFKAGLVTEQDVKDTIQLYMQNG
jgi:hypothetical protein